MRRFGVATLPAMAGCARATRYGNDPYTPSGTADSTAFGPDRTSVASGIFPKF